ncbi:glycine cleavage system H-protein subunit [Ascosphaera acerosa]|nr:glycine cleavage system H-protein subunit [Ascosphaera acerosa]
MAASLARSSLALPLRGLSRPAGAAAALRCAATRPAPAAARVPAHCSRTAPSAAHAPGLRAFSQASIWQARRFTEQHEWVDLAEDSKTATIGITKYAADALGDVIYVELPEVDAAVEAGDTIGVVESVKSASDVMSPVGGTVVEVNEALAAEPKVVNSSPEGEAWFARIKMEDTAEFDALLSEEKYQALVAEEGEH